MDSGARELRLSEVQERLYDVLVSKKRNSHQNGEERIDPRGFGCYSKDIIEADIRYVERLEAAFKENERHDPELAKGRMRGELFEEIIFMGIEDGDWMGGDVSIQKSSRFDDIANGVDGIITFTDEVSDSHMAFGVDITQSANSVAEKFLKIKKSIRAETLSEVKYFKTESYEGRLLKVPRVIVGVDGEGMEAAAGIVDSYIGKKDYLLSPEAKNLEGQQKTDAKRRFFEAQHAFASAVFQMVILYQMSLQLNAFMEYSKKLKRDRAAAIYEKALRRIDSIYFSKLAETGVDGKKLIDVKAVHSYIQNDKVCNMIKQQVVNFGIDNR